jgi:hypothetical protein
VQHIAREVPAPLELLGIVATENTDAQMMGRPLDAEYFLKRAGDPQWRPLPNLTLTPGTFVTDIVQLNPSGTHLLLATDKEGYQATSDGGATWASFNHGESALVSPDGQLQTLAFGEPATIYAMVDRFRVSDDLGSTRPNLLFHYLHRSWLERLRVGLAALLTP